MRRMPTIKLIRKHVNMYISIILLNLLFGCKKSAEESLYIIPNKYKGTVVIIFNQKNGVPAQYKNGIRMYKIPENGVLKTQLKANFGLSKFRMMYGDFGELKYMTAQDWRSYPEDSDEIVCWNLESGVTQDSNNQKINFEVFSVGSVKESEKISDQKRDFLTLVFQPK
jgi:hypothetical protein